jgi:endoglucanase
VRSELGAYGAAGWDGARIAREIGLAGAWARRHGVVVVCGELGVYRRVVDPVDRDRWLRDVRVALEEQGIGWALWEYHHNFGLVEPGPAGRRPVASMAAALGLNPVG